MEILLYIGYFDRIYFRSTMYIFTLILICLLFDSVLPLSVYVYFSSALNTHAQFVYPYKFFSLSLSVCLSARIYVAHKHIQFLSVSCFCFFFFTPIKYANTNSYPKKNCNASKTKERNSDDN